MNGFYHKYNELESIIGRYNPTFFTLNETRHRRQTPLHFTGYEIVQKSGTLDVDNNAHGGVAIMIKDDVKVEIINLNTELQVIAIKTLFPFKMTIAAIYIPPNLNTIPTSDQLDELERQLPKPFILVGDVNSRHINLLSTYSNNLGKLIVNFVNNNDLAIINDDKVTRVGVHGESAMLDLVMVTGDLAGIFEVETTEEFYGSDHKLIKVTTVQKLVEVRNANYNYKRADMKKFSENAKLSEIDLENDMDNINDNFTHKIIRSADIAIPKFNTRFNSERCKAWWSKEMGVLHKKMTKLNSKWRRIRRNPNFNPAYIAVKKSEYYKVRYEFNEKREEAKKKVNEDFCLSVTKDTTNGVIWKKVRATEGKRSKSKSNFFYDVQTNTCITDKKIIAEKFSVEFQKNFENDSVINVNENPVKIIDEKNAEYLNYNFTTNELSKVIRKAKNTSPGKDKISAAMIKNLNENDTIWLLDYFNKIWNCGKVPSEWKKSLAIPIPKDYTQKHNIEKYRPIQLISVPAKMLQNMAANRLNYHLEKHNLNHNYQFGFRAKRSTTDNLMLFEDKVRTAIEKKCEVVVVFFDLAKAFDSVKSEKIIECLKEIGIHGKFLEYSKDFFKDLSYQVRFDGELSSEKPQTNGVPQGSGLSVQYFKIVMNQMKKFIDNENIYLFVDDFLYIKILTHANQGKTYEKEIQEDMKKIENWADHYGLKISVPKTKVMKFTLKQNPTDTPKVKLYNNEIEEVNSFKLLGVIFQKNLKYDQSVNETVKRIDKDLNVLKYLSSYKLNIDRKALLHVLDAKVRSKIEYINFLLIHESKKVRNKLRVKYNEGLRICLGALRTTHIPALYAEAGKISLEKSAEIKMMKYVTNVLSNDDNPVKKRVLKILNENEVLIHHRKKVRNSILKTATHKLEEINLINIKAVKTFFTHPPWIRSKITIDKSVHVHPKESQDSEVWQMIYASESEKYDKNHMCFTDGSVRDNRAAWAVTSEDNLIKSGRIHDDSTILTAEMRALIEAVKSSESYEVVAVTDSLSTCDMLISMNPRNNNCRYIANELFSTNKRITLMWAPSHKGITGNETADRFAGEAINSEECEEITENDAKNSISRKMYEKENENWRSVHAEKNLRRLKNDIDMLVFPRTMKRIDQVKVTRLRLGYIKHTEEWKYHQHEGYIGQACEECECFTSVHHIFAECRVTEDDRIKFNISFEDLNNTSRFDDIIAFVKEIGLFSEI